MRQAVFGIVPSLFLYCRFCQFCRLNALQAQQFCLDVDAAAVSRERSVFSDHAVAGDHKWDRIGAIGGAHGSDCCGAADGRRNI